MRVFFTDTLYWVALSNRFDQWHSRVTAFSQSVERVPIVTTDQVLAEFLAHYSRAGPRARLEAVALVRSLFDNPMIEVVEFNRSAFLAALDFYQARLDKGYSLTDCHAMILMRERGIGEVLTRDVHFTQEGFTLLL